MCRAYLPFICSIGVPFSKLFYGIHCYSIHDQPMRVIWVTFSSSEGVRYLLLLREFNVLSRLTIFTTKTDPIKLQERIKQLRNQRQIFIGR